MIPYPISRLAGRRPSLRSALVVPAIAAVLLAGCTGGDDEPEETPTATATVEVTETPTEAPATETPTGTATATSTVPASPTATSTSEAPVEGTPGGNPDGEPTAEDAVDVIDAYFGAINDGDYETAYALWRNEGEASGQTFEEFAAGYEETASVTWETGEPGRIDPGAGQRYIPIPVTITTTTTSGETQRFEGEYVLHHTADIEGATPEQRVWRIHSADIEQVE